MTRKRLLITGGSGFIGTNLVTYHKELGDDVVNADILAPRDPEHEDVWHHVDILRPTQLDDIVRSSSPTHIVHLAARTDLHGRTVDDYAANTDGVANLVNACRLAPDLERVIFASSRMVCRIGYQPASDTDYCPPNPYGLSKVFGEKLVRDWPASTPWTILRPTSIWGPWFDIPYRTFFMSIYRGRYFHVRGRRPTKSFGYVGNSVHQIRRVLDAPATTVGATTMYLADYPPLNVPDFANAIQSELGVREIKTLPLSVVRAAAGVGDMLRAVGWKEPPLTSFRLDNLLTEMVYDLSPLEEICGALPFNMEHGVRETVRWLRDYGLVTAP